MTVEKLIEILLKIDKDKLVVIADADGIGWDNIGEVLEEGSWVRITQHGGELFF